MKPQTLRSLMPKNLDDVAGARDITSLDPKDVKPLVPEMLRLMNHHQKPVSNEFCLFFERHGEQFADDIAPVLNRKTMYGTTHLLLTRVLPLWSTNSVSRCKSNLQGLVTHTDAAFNNDLLAVMHLAEHDLADADWLKGWLDFKLRGAKGRFEIAKKVESILKARRKSR